MKHMIHFYGSQTTGRVPDLNERLLPTMKAASLTCSYSTNTGHGHGNATIFHYLTVPRYSIMAEKMNCPLTCIPEYTTMFLRTLLKKADSDELANGKKGTSEEQRNPEVRKNERAGSNEEATLRDFLFLEIQETVKKYDLIYYRRVNLVRMERDIQTGSYTLSPFWIISRLKGFPFKMHSVCFYRFETRDEFDLEEDYLGLKLEDEVILLSLANLLSKYVIKRNLFLEQSFPCILDENAAIDFYHEVSKWSDLRYLFVIDLSSIQDTLCRKRLVDKIKPHIYDTFILNLLDSFLHSPIRGYKGKNLALKDGIPPVRFLQPLLLDFFLDDLDRDILDKFPNSRDSMINCSFH